MSRSQASELDRKLRDLSVMYELISSIGNTLDLQFELDLFLGKILKKFGFSFGNILLKSEQGSDFYVASARGHFCSKSLIGRRCQADRAGIDEIIRNKKPLLHQRVSDELKKLCMSREIWEKTRALAYLPIVFDEEVVGILHLASFSDKVVSEKMLRMMKPVNDRLGTVISHLLMLNRLRETEEKLRYEKEFTEVAINSLADAFFVIDANNRKLVRWNEQASQLMGRGMTKAERLGCFSEHCGEVMSPAFEAVVNQIERLNGFGEIVLTADDGESLPLDVSVSTFINEHDEQDYIIAVARDIRERKKAEQEKKDLEEQLHQKYKMEAVGLMAGGITHNFNNSLAIVLGNLEMAQRKADSPDRVKEHIDHARTAVLRARDLVGQIMTYSRKGAQTMRTVGLADILTETLNLLRSTNPSTIELSCDIAPECETAKVNADPGRIQEVLLNLYANAVHAMNEKGTIACVLEVVELRSGDIPLQYDCSPGKYACISVRDSGCGMTAEVLGRIFDPFFTTKQSSQGTGMGLPTVQGILNRHGGFVKVSSVPGQGSTFSLYLPLTDASLASDLTHDAEIQGGTEHILYVDDEPMISALASEMLCGLGYQVTTADSAEKVFQLFKEKSGLFDLVITDQTMPGMTGKDLCQSLHQKNAHLPLILCSGYSSQISNSDIGHNGIRAVCSKPLQLAELSKIIRTVLDDH